MHLWLICLWSSLHRHAKSVAVKQTMERKELISKSLEKTCISLCCSPDMRHWFLTNSFMNGGMDAEGKMAEIWQETKCSRKFSEPPDCQRMVTLPIMHVEAEIELHKRMEHMRHTPPVSKKHKMREEGLEPGGILSRFIIIEQKSKEANYITFMTVHRGSLFHHRRQVCHWSGLTQCVCSVYMNSLHGINPLWMQRKMNSTYSKMLSNLTAINPAMSLWAPPTGLGPCVTRPLMPAGGIYPQNEEKWQRWGQTKWMCLSRVGGPLVMHCRDKRKCLKWAAWALVSPGTEQCSGKDALWEEWVHCKVIALKNCICSAELGQCTSPH